jgi:hypothetical protein
MRVKNQRGAYINGETGRRIMCSFGLGQKTLNLPGSSVKILGYDLASDILNVIIKKKRDEYESHS